LNVFYKRKKLYFTMGKRKLGYEKNDKSYILALLFLVLEYFYQSSLEAF